MIKFRIILFLLSAVFMLIVCEHVRRRKIIEKYALLWIGVAFIVLLISLFPYLLIKLSNILGVYYLSTILLICFFFLLLITFSFTIAISKLIEKNTVLAQELAILKNTIEKNKNNKNI